MSEPQEQYTKEWQRICQQVRAAEAESGCEFDLADCFLWRGQLCAAYLVRGAAGRYRQVYVSTPINEKRGWRKWLTR
jgi:hypothetical protein